MQQQPFTTYLRSHEISRHYASELRIKPPGMRGYEMLREDMHNPEYERKHERHMNAYRTQRNTNQDHNRPTSVSPIMFNGEKLCERKSKGTFNRSCEVSPVTSTWNFGTSKQAPSDRSAVSTMRTTGKARAWGNTLPSYDPIRHIVTQQSADGTLQSLRNRENERLWGTLGIKYRSPPQGSYDPIRHQYTAAPDLTVAAPSAKQSRGRTPILAGETWGQRDPIRGEYTIRPRSATTTKTINAPEPQGISRKARVATPPSQGIYDPIRNSWISPPQDSKIIEGLSFAPRGMFSTYGRTL